MANEIWRNDHEAWLFGAKPWSWRIGLGALEPVSLVKHYRVLRRPRWHYHLPTQTPVVKKPAWSRRGALSFALFCRWQQLTGFRREWVPPEERPKSGLLGHYDGYTPAHRRRAK